MLKYLIGHKKYLLIISNLKLYFIDEVILHVTNMSCVIKA